MNELDSNQHQHNAFVRWKYTWHGRLVWGLVNLGIAYIFGSLAVDTGSLWQYGVAILFFLNGVYNLVRCIGKLTHGNSTDTH